MTYFFPLDEYSDALHTAFGDKRRGQRIGELLRAMREHLTLSIRQLSFSRAQQKAFYGVLDQAKVTQNALIAMVTGRCAGLVCDRQLLVISDTSEINLQKHRGRLKPDEETLGVVGNNSDLGFFVHPSLCIPAWFWMPGRGMCWALAISSCGPAHATKAASTAASIPNSPSKRKSR